jgi:hypothetical protein
MNTVPLLSGLYQIAYVTRDLEAGTRQLATIHASTASASSTMSRVVAYAGRGD